MSSNRGRLFFSCDKSCGFLKWDDGEFSGCGSDKTNNKVDIENLTRLLKMCAQTSDKGNIEISFNITIRKSNETVHGKGKEKL